MSRQKIVEVHVPPSKTPRERKMVNVKTHIEETIKGAIAAAKNDVAKEEARLRALGQKVAGPFERFARAVRAGVVAFRATI